MKVAILAGGKGTRISEETQLKPKPMVEIGGRPILWHIMKLYAHFGFNEFLIALGYRGEVIKRYFADHCASSGDLRAGFQGGGVVPCLDDEIEWSVDLIDTGIETMTGGRIKRLAPHIGDETFMLTWGDGLANVDLVRLVEFHQAHGKLATMTIVHPPARFGHIELRHDQVVEFNEKPQLEASWINGAFFVLEPGVMGYIEGDDVMWEHAPLKRLARDGELMAFKHTSFWQCMDTVREKQILESMWQSGKPPWKIWDAQ